jgi:hypothetical protein
MIILIDLQPCLAILIESICRISEWIEEEMSFLNLINPMVSWQLFSKHALKSPKVM